MGSSPIAPAILKEHSNEYLKSLDLFEAFLFLYITMLKLQKNSFEPYNRDANGNIKSYRVKLDTISFEDQRLNERYNNLKREISILLKCRSNLQEAQEILMELSVEHYENGYPKNNISKVAQSMLCIAANLYCSCFSNSDLSKGKPLKFEMNDKNKLELHTMIRDLKDKRFSHIDKNDEVRNDDIYLIFKYEDRTYTPQETSVSINYISALHDHKLRQWYNFIDELLLNIKKKLVEHEKELQHLIGSFTL